MLVEKLAPKATIRNYAKDALTRKEIDALLAVAPVADIINTRHKVAKENGWKEKAPSKTAFAKALMAEPNLIRRPILVKGKSFVVGKDLEGIRKLLE